MLKHPYINRERKYQVCTKTYIHSNSVILLGLPNAPQNLFPNFSKLSTCVLSAVKTRLQNH